nr:MAG TPA: hypothetical protein [Caudoviricetes sp.]
MTVTREPLEYRRLMKAVTHVTDATHLIHPHSPHNSYSSPVTPVTPVTAGHIKCREAKADNDYCL